MCACVSGICVSLCVGVYVLVSLCLVFVHVPVCPWLCVCVLCVDDASSVDTGGLRLTCCCSTPVFGVMGSQAVRVDQL